MPFSAAPSRPTSVRGSGGPTRSVRSPAVIRSAWPAIVSIGRRPRRITPKPRPGRRAARPPPSRWSGSSQAVPWSCSRWPGWSWRSETARDRHGLQPEQDAPVGGRSRCAGRALDATVAAVGLQDPPEPPAGLPLVGGPAAHPLAVDTKPVIRPGRRTAGAARARRRPGWPWPGSGGIAARHRPGGHDPGDGGQPGRRRPVSPTVLELLVGLAEQVAAHARSPRRSRTPPARPA